MALGDILSLFSASLFFFYLLSCIWLCQYPMHLLLFPSFHGFSFLISLHLLNTMSTSFTSWSWPRIPLDTTLLIKTSLLCLSLCQWYWFVAQWLKNLFFIHSWHSEYLFFVLTFFFSNCCFKWFSLLQQLPWILWLLHEGQVSENFPIIGAKESNPVHLWPLKKQNQI